MKKSGEKEAPEPEKEQSGKSAGKTVGGEQEVMTETREGGDRWRRQSRVKNICPKHSGRTWTGERNGTRLWERSSLQKRNLHSLAISSLHLAFSVLLKCFLLFNTKIKSEGTFHFKCP